MLGISRGARSFTDIQRINLHDDDERKSVLGCVEGGIALAKSLISIDSSKIGLTGFSDGGATVQYALLHTKWVAAAAISHGTWEPNYAMAVGPSSQAMMERFGYPRFSEWSSEFWSRNSLRQNTERVDAPILLQIPDGEFLSAIEGYTALRDAGKAVDLFVFPGEYHVKWQPAHRLAVYQRSLNWFKFWFGIGDLENHSTPDLIRWRQLRDDQAR
jgi:dipeptidyl aminopeptidase/acylaminoacyl peptidase